MANVNIKNKVAYHEYSIEEKLDCGIVLQGTEIKAIREGRMNIKESFVTIRGGEMFLHNSHIGHYSHGNIHNHDETRARKLLATKKQISDFESKVKRDSYTIVPLSVYFVNGRAKVSVGLAKGKKLHDKRRDKKEKDIKRDVQRQLKNY